MIEIEKPRIETIEISEDAKFGKFVVEPLERGYGTTLGNSLRRILLSSLPGAAVKYIEIEGVLHEFSAIDNVVEDVSTIIMNIKKLALKIYSEEDKTLEIDVRDEGEVTASDITHDSDVEVLNPELKIATVSKGGHLKIRLVANKGRGYALAEQNNTSDLPIGVIPV
ncbi:MAG: DNA-directed RNA polymerase subunit alpha, partial [Staphylococcus sp.]|nr:DNA-directed RNA polymerase subunit alpha [Staphylococcus sp.]